MSTLPAAEVAWQTSPFFVIASVLYAVASTASGVNLPQIQTNKQTRPFGQVDLRYRLRKLIRQIATPIGDIDSERRNLRPRFQIRSADHTKPRQSEWPAEPR